MNSKKKIDERKKDVEEESDNTERRKQGKVVEKTGEGGAQSDRQADRQTDSLTDGPTGLQADKHTHGWTERGREGGGDRVHFFTYNLVCLHTHWYWYHEAFAYSCETLPKAANLSFLEILSQTNLKMTPSNKPGTVYAYDKRLTV